MTKAGQNNLYPKRTIKQQPYETNIRNLPTVATTHIGNDTTNTNNTIFFTESLNITGLEFFCVNNTVDTPNAIDDAILFVVNAPDAATAKAWLEDIGGSEAAVQYLPLNYIDQQAYAQNAPITRVDYLPLNDISRIITIGSTGVL